MGISQLDEWSEKKQQRVTVGEGGGFLYNIQLQSKVDSSPDGGFVATFDFTCWNRKHVWAFALLRCGVPPAHGNLFWGKCKPCA